jgi:hypothetical protein
MSYPDFQQYEKSHLKYRISIPRNWSLPAYFDVGEKIIYSTSPDRKQAIYIGVWTPGGYGLEQFVQNALDGIKSKGTQPLRHDRYFWGQYPAQYIVFPNYVTLFIEANGFIYNLAAAGEGVHLDGQTTNSILSSFQIFPSVGHMQQADLQRIQANALQWQMVFKAQEIFYETALKGIWSGWKRWEYR